MTVAVPSPTFAQQLTATAVPTLADCLPLTHRLGLMLFISYCTYNCNFFRESTPLMQNKVQLQQILQKLLGQTLTVLQKASTRKLWMVELLYRMLSLELELWPREEKQSVYIAASKIYDMLNPMYKSTFQYIYIPFLNSYIV